MRFGCELWQRSGGRGGGGGGGGEKRERERERERGREGGVVELSRVRDHSPARPPARRLATPRSLDTSAAAPIVAHRRFPKTHSTTTLSLSSLTHKHIIRFCEAFLDNDCLYIITEYARKGDVGKKVKRYIANQHRIKETVIWSYLIQVGGGGGRRGGGEN